MQNSKLNSNGFGMMEVLASMAIGGIVMLSSSKMVSNQLSAQRNLAVTASFNNSMLQLNQYLSYKNNCTNGLLPANYSIDTDSNGIPLNLSNITQVPYSGNPIIGVSAAGVDFSVNAISVEFNTTQPAGSTPDSFLANLVFRGTKTGSSTGPSPLYSAIPIYVQLSPAANQKRTFVSCATSTGTSVNTDCPPGKFYQSAAVGCVPPVELLSADPQAPFAGEMWIRTDL